MVHLPVSSHSTSAFPPLGQGRHLACVRAATSTRARLRGCSHSLMFRPLSLLATQIAPTDTTCAVWQPWRLLPSTVKVVTFLHVGYANRLNRATDGKRTFTSLDSQPCRLLP